MEHLRPVAALGILLRQGVEFLIGVILQEADVRPSTEVQLRNAIQHGHLQIAGAVAQIVAVECAADALALQGMEILQGIPFILKARQPGQIVEGLRLGHDDVGLHRRCGGVGAVLCQDLVDPGQDLLHVGFAVSLRALLGLKKAVPPETQRQTVGVVAVGRSQAGVHIHLKNRPRRLGSLCGKQPNGQGQGNGKSDKAAPPGEQRQPPHQNQNPHTHPQGDHRHPEIHRRAQLSRHTGHLSHLCRQAEVRQHQWRAVDSCLEIVHQGQHQSGNPHQYSGKPQSTQQRPQGEHHSAVKDAGQQQIGGPFHEPLPHDGEGTGNHPLDGHRHSQPHAKAAAQKHDPAQPHRPQRPGPLLSLQHFYLISQVIKRAAGISRGPDNLRSVCQFLRQIALQLVDGQPHLPSRKSTAFAGPLSHLIPRAE